MEAKYKKELLRQLSIMEDTLTTLKQIVNKATHTSKVSVDILDTSEVLSTLARDIEIEEEE